MVARESFKITLSRIFLSLWLILLIYHLSLLLLHVFVTKVKPVVLSNEKAQVLSDIFWILLFVVFAKIESVIKNQFRNHQKHGILRV